MELQVADGEDLRANPDAVSPTQFWKAADQLQHRTLAEADVLFSYLQTATPDKLRDILIQYRYFTIYYIADLSLLIARLPGGATRSFLANILCDELGFGDPQKAHPELYDDFLETIGVDRAGLEQQALLGNVELLEDARRELVDPQRTFEYGIGLRGMGGECICQVYIAQLHKHLMRNAFIERNKNVIDWRFWDLHVGDHDVAHREQTRALIDAAFVKPGGRGLKELSAGYASSIAQWRKFWTNIFALKDESKTGGPFKRGRIPETFNMSA